MTDEEYIACIRERAQRLAKAKHWSLKDLARVAGVGNATAYLTHDIRICSLRRIADALGVTVSTLIGEDTRMDAKKCDRCGTYYEAPVSKDTAKLQLRTYEPGGSGARVDICSACTKALEKWYKPLEPWGKEIKPGGGTRG